MLVECEYLTMIDRRSNRPKVGQFLSKVGVACKGSNLKVLSLSRRGWRRTRGVLFWESKFALEEQNRREREIKVLTQPLRRGGCRVQRVRYCLNRVTSNRWSSVDDERESRRHLSASVVAAAAPLGDADNAEAEAPGGGGAGSRGAARWRGRERAPGRRRGGACRGRGSKKTVI